MRTMQVLYRLSLLLVAGLVENLLPVFTLEAGLDVPGLGKVILNDGTPQR